MISVNKVYVILLNNTDPNRKVIQKKIENLPLHKDAEIEFFQGVDGSKLNDKSLEEIGVKVYSNWKIESDNPWWKEHMRSGEIGCALSHWKVWVKAFHEGHDKVLILEEDFEVVRKDFSCLETSVNWELLYLGRKLNGIDTPWSKSLVKPGYSYNAHAYMLQRSGIQKLLNSGFEKNLIPVDEFLPTTYIDHPRLDISTIFTTKLEALAVKDNLVEQEKSGKSTTENIESDFQFLKDYEPIHPSLYDAYGESTSKWVSKYVNSQLVSGEYDLICDEPILNLYSFPMFKGVFCQELIEEANNFGQWTYRRHKNYPTTDMLLRSFGLDLVYSYILRRYVYPLCLHVYNLSEEWSDMKSENFIAKYEPNQQGHLSLHHDSSVLSVIVSLNTNFEGGGTYFPKYKKLVTSSLAGQAILFPGKLTHYHGARAVVKGSRYIIATFLKN